MVPFGTVPTDEKLTHYQDLGIDEVVLRVPSGAPGNVAGARRICGLPRTFRRRRWQRLNSPVGGSGRRQTVGERRKRGSLAAAVRRLTTWHGDISGPSRLARRRGSSSQIRWPTSSSSSFPRRDPSRSAGSPMRADPKPIDGGDAVRCGHRIVQSGRVADRDRVRSAQGLRPGRLHRPV